MGEPYSAPSSTERSFRSEFDLLVERLLEAQTRVTGLRNTIAGSQAEKGDSKLRAEPNGYVEKLSNLHSIAYDINQTLMSIEKAVGV